MAHQHQCNQTKRTASRLSHCGSRPPFQDVENRDDVSRRRLRDASRRHWLSSTAHVGKVFKSTPMVRGPVKEDPVRRRVPCRTTRCHSGTAPPRAVKRVRIRSRALGTVCPRRCQCTSRHSRQPARDRTCGCERAQGRPMPVPLQCTTRDLRGGSRNTAPPRAPKSSTPRRRATKATIGAPADGDTPRAVGGSGGGVPVNSCISSFSIPTAGVTSMSRRCGAVVLSSECGSARADPWRSGLPPRSTGHHATQRRGCVRSPHGPSRVHAAANRCPNATRGKVHGKVRNSSEEHEPSGHRKLVHSSNKGLARALAGAVEALPL